MTSLSSASDINPAIAALMRAYSIEVTFPTPTEIEALREHLGPDSLVYVSAPPNHSRQELAQAIARVRSAGFEPVPHLAARGFTGREELEEFIRTITGEAGVTRALTIAGDIDKPRGPFIDALALIESDVLQRHRLVEVGISAYPDGHPKIADDRLSAALKAKLDAAYARGLAVHIVTQFCFDAEKILEWLRRVRYARIDVPIRIGIAGPTTLRTLMRYALKCGVRASLSGLTNPKAMQLFGEAAPDQLIATLAQSIDRLKLDAALHLFSFGGAMHTAHWANMMAAGKIKFEG
ncbi:MAG TPA: methylenetetrahydrofolate reductase [Xanthobacteraceae bacterium]|jgi:methylenetetrahydrofolate reductase (NADPH)|nr:methylenetetrahydrofolate reductase [Xanthobacteraceae bacterium]